MNSSVINILGYSGSHMSLIFESLRTLNFTGLVRIIMHDDTKYFDVPFQTGINYEVIKHIRLGKKPDGYFFFCSNNPQNKYFLLKFFKGLWDLDNQDFTSIIHPSAVVASTVIHEEGLYIEPLSVVSPYARLGFGVSVNRNCSIGHHNLIEAFCSFYPGSNLAGDVELGRSVTIGPGTTVFAGVKIGEHTVIGGGSVVTENIPPYVVAYGNPCKVIKENPPVWDQKKLF